MNAVAEEEEEEGEEKEGGGGGPVEYRRFTHPAAHCTPSARYWCEETPVSGGRC